MNRTAALGERAAGNIPRKSLTRVRRTSGRPTVLIATIDLEIREALANLFQGAPLNAIWVKSVGDVQTATAREGIAACLCGLWLQDGTYREVIRHLRRERLEIPAIIVSAPACPQEFRDYLAAMNLEDLNFLAYPYQLSDLEQMLGFAISGPSRSVGEMGSEETHELRQRGAA
jgi:DNA-binding NtrC family response regulator